MQCLKSRYEPIKQCLLSFLKGTISQYHKVSPVKLKNWHSLFNIGNQSLLNPGQLKKVNYLCPSVIV